MTGLSSMTGDDAGKLNGTSEPVYILSTTRPDSYPPGVSLHNLPNHKSAPDTTPVYTNNPPPCSSTTPMYTHVHPSIPTLVVVTALPTPASTNTTVTVPHGNNSNNLKLVTLALALSILMQLCVLWVFYSELHLYYSCFFFGCFCSE